MSRAFWDTLITSEPPDSHGIRWAWYVFIKGSPPRGGSGRRSTVSHGPHGRVATSMASSSPQ